MFACDGCFCPTRFDIDIDFGRPGIPETEATSMALKMMRLREEVAKNPRTLGLKYVYVHTVESTKAALFL